jgi:hypothetical protein
MRVEGFGVERRDASSGGTHWNMHVSAARGGESAISLDRGNPPIFSGAGDELTTTVRRLQTSIKTERRSRRADEPGHECGKTYQPDAEETLQNPQNPASVLRTTGTIANDSPNNFDHQDLQNAAEVADPEFRPTVGVGDSAVPHAAPVSLGTASQWVSDPGVQPSRSATPVDGRPGSGDRVRHTPHARQ